MGILEISGEQILRGKASSRPTLICLLSFFFFLLLSVACGSHHYSLPCVETISFRNYTCRYINGSYSSWRHHQASICSLHLSLVISQALTTWRPFPKPRPNFVNSYKIKWPMLLLPMFLIRYFLLRAPSVRWEVADFNFSTCCSQFPFKTKCLGIIIQQISSHLAQSSLYFSLISCVFSGKPTKPKANNFSQTIL